MIQATVGVIHDFSKRSCALQLFARVINAIIVFSSQSADKSGINETEVKQTIWGTAMSHKMRQCKNIGLIARSSYSKSLRAPILAHTTANSNALLLSGDRIKPCQIKERFVRPKADACIEVANNKWQAVTYFCRSLVQTIQSYSSTGASAATSPADRCICPVHRNRRRSGTRPQIDSGVHNSAYRIYIDQQCICHGRNTSRGTLCLLIACARAHVSVQTSNRQIDGKKT